MNKGYIAAESTCFPSRQMESSLDSIESSLRKLELCPGAKLAIWPYGAIKVDKSNVTGIGNITKYIERKLWKLEQSECISSFIFRMTDQAKWPDSQ